MNELKTALEANSLLLLLLDLLPFIIMAFHFTDKWFLSKGKLWQVYILVLFGSFSTIIYNLLLVVMMNGKHQSLLVFSVNSVWTILMSVKGMLRLMREKK